MNTELTDIYRRLTNRTIEAVERGAGDWKMPWRRTKGDSFAPINVFSTKLYRGANVPSLWAAAEQHGCPTALWATYKP